MKRVLLWIVLLVLAGGGAAAWWMLRDTPEKVLADGIQSLVAMKSVGGMSVDVAVTDLASRVTTGFSAEGQVNLADLTKAQGLAAIRVAAHSQTEQDEIIDALLTAKSVFLRPREVSAAHVVQYVGMSGDPTQQTFLSFDRSAFLEKFGYVAVNAAGSDAEVRAAMRFLAPTMMPTALSTGEMNGVPVVTAQFHFNKPALRAFLMTMVKVWTGKTPTPEGYAWVERVAAGMSQGVYTLSLAQATREVVRITADASAVDAKDAEVQRIHAIIDFENVGALVRIQDPQPAKNVTALIRSTELRSLTGAESREVPAGIPTTTRAIPTGNAQIDLFSKLQDQMIKKKKSR